MTRVLVTGGTGIIGAYVVRALLQRGDEVVVVSSRGDPALLGSAAAEVELVRGDVCDAESMRALLVRRRSEVVIHLAALLPARCTAEPALAVQVNVTATAALYAAASRGDVARFVYASSKSAYGPNLSPEHGPPEYRPISEDTPAAPVWMYDITKRAGEQVIEAQRARGGPEATSLRFATIYAPGKGGRHGGASTLSRLVAAGITGESFTLERGGDQVDDVIWVGDAAEGVVRAAAAAGPLAELYNISSGTGIRIADFAARVRVLFPRAQLQIGPGLCYMGPEPTYGVLDASRARRDLGLVIDSDPGRGIALFAGALRVMARENQPDADGPSRGWRHRFTHNQ